MQATFTSVAEVVAIAMAAGGIVFQAGYSFSTLKWLKDNSVTKADLEVLRATVVAATAQHVEETADTIRRKCVNQELCAERHTELTRRLQSLRE